MTDQTDTSTEDVQYCARLNSYRKHVSADVHSTRSVTILLNDVNVLICMFPCLSVEEAQVHPLLGKVPVKLWAKVNMMWVW